MDINRLRYFTVIAKTGSLTEASKILKVSAPALSKAMSILESELDAALFENVGRGIVITDNGRKLLPRTEAILDDLESLKSEVSSTAGSSRLRIGTFEVFSTYFLRPLLEKGLEEFEIDLIELVPGELEQALRDERVDIGITYIPIAMPMVDFLKVGKVKMGVYGLSSFSKNAELASLPFAVPILPIQGAPTKVSGLDGWPDNKIPRYQKYRVTLMESALQLCRQGLSVAYLPSFVAALHNEQVAKKFNLVELEVPNTPKVHQEVFLVKRSGTSEDKKIKRIAKVIRQVCRNA